MGLRSIQIEPLSLTAEWPVGNFYLSCLATQTSLLTLLTPMTRCVLLRQNTSLWTQCHGHRPMDSPYVRLPLHPVASCVTLFGVAELDQGRFSFHWSSSPFIPLHSTLLCRSVRIKAWKLACEKWKGGVKGRAVWEGTVCAWIVAARARWTEAEAGLIPEGWPGPREPLSGQWCCLMPWQFWERCLEGGPPQPRDLLPLPALWASQLPRLQTGNNDSICFAGWLRSSAELTLKTHLE